MSNRKDLEAIAKHIAKHPQYGTSVQRLARSWLWQRKYIERLKFRLQAHE